VCCFGLLLFGLTACSDKESKMQNDPIYAVEHSLRPVITLEDDLGWNISDRMEHYGVPGASIAVIANGEVAWHKHYGVVDLVSEDLVEESTLFQAASISKPLTAMAIMRLVQDGTVHLDSNVNNYLSEWQLEKNHFNRDTTITLRHILSHTGGISVHGFPGYHPDEELPTLLDILDSDGVANTWVVRPAWIPGEYHYSGGGYCILQQLLIEQSGKPFAEFMQEVVLDPLQMMQSTFQQPLDPERLKAAASGYLPDGQMVDGRRHVYPEMAAAGLWTTAQDLAKFGMDMQNSYQTSGGSVLNDTTAHEMLLPFFHDHVACGLFLQDHEGEIYFSHGGWNAGFSSELLMHRDRDFGVVVMINSNHPEFISEVIRSVASTYQWQGYPLYTCKSRAVDDATLREVCGRYKYTSDQVVEIYEKNDSLFLQYLGGDPEPLFYTADDLFVRREREAKIKIMESEGQQYLVFITAENDSLRHDHPKLSTKEKVPFEYILAGDFKKARVEYLKLERIDASDRDLMTYQLSQKAELLLEQEEFEKAIAILEISAELHPGSYMVFHELAEAYLQDGNQEKALRNYRKSLKFYPQNEEAKRMIERLENPLVEI